MYCKVQYVARIDFHHCSTVATNVCSFLCAICIHVSVSFPDINECTSIMPCSHICHNVPGSFVCECREGYDLVGSVDCEGKHTAECIQVPCSNQ